MKAIEALREVVDRDSNETDRFCCNLPEIVEELEEESSRWEAVLKKTNEEHEHAIDLIKDKIKSVLRNFDYANPLNIQDRLEEIIDEPTTGGEDSRQDNAEVERSG